MQFSSLIGLVTFGLAASAVSLPSVQPRDTIDSVHTTYGNISVYTPDGSKVGCLNADGNAITDLSGCETFTSNMTYGHYTFMNTPFVNYTIASSKGFCGVVWHGNDSTLNQGVGHLWMCSDEVPGYQAPSSGYYNIEYFSGTDALIGKLVISSGYSGYNLDWNTIGGANINSTTPAAFQSRLPDYPLGQDYVFVPEYSP